MARGKWGKDEQISDLLEVRKSVRINSVYSLQLLTTLSSPHKNGTDSSKEIGESSDTRQ